MPLSELLPGRQGMAVVCHNILEILDLVNVELVGDLCVST